MRSRTVGLALYGVYGCSSVHVCAPARTGVVSSSLDYFVGHITSVISSIQNVVSHITKR